MSKDKRTVEGNTKKVRVWNKTRGGCHLCGKRQKFRREYPIPPYTADFCCVALKLILEVDGEHHQTDEGRQHDTHRDRYLAKHGYTLLRIPGHQVTRDPARVRCLIENAIDKRIEHLGPLTPDPSPPTKLGGEGRRKSSKIAKCVGYKTFGSSCECAIYRPILKQGSWAGSLHSEFQLPAQLAQRITLR